MGAHRSDRHVVSAWVDEAAYQAILVLGGGSISVGLRKCVQIATVGVYAASVNGRGSESPEVSEGVYASVNAPQRASAGQLPSRHDERPASQLSRPGAGGACLSKHSTEPIRVRLPERATEPHRVQAFASARGDAGTEAPEET